MSQETVAEKVSRTRRAAGLPDRIDDPLIERVAAMVRSTPTRPPARVPAGAHDREPTDDEGAA